MKFYLSMECGHCGEDILYGPVLCLTSHAGLPVVPFDIAAGETFTCDHCGTEHHTTGDFYDEVEEIDKADCPHCKNAESEVTA